MKTLTLIDATNYNINQNEMKLFNLFNKNFENIYNKNLYRIFNQELDLKSNMKSEFTFYCFKTIARKGEEFINKLKYDYIFEYIYRDVYKKYNEKYISSLLKNKNKEDEEIETDFEDKKENVIINIENNYIINMLEAENIFDKKEGRKFDKEEMKFRKREIEKLKKNEVIKKYFEKL